jgi:hypothetical protein
VFLLNANKNNSASMYEDLLLFRACKHFIVGKNKKMLASIQKEREKTRQTPLAL